MSFTKHSPPTATTNQHQPPNQQIKHPTSTNQHHPTNKSTTQPTSTNITQQTNQQPFSTKNNKKTDSFPSLFQRIPRYQGVGPKHAKIQKSDHLTRSDKSSDGSMDGREGSYLHPTGMDLGWKQTNHMKDWGKFFTNHKFTTSYIIVGWMLGMYLYVLIFWWFLNGITLMLGIYVGSLFSIGDEM